MDALCRAVVLVLFAACATPTPLPGRAPRPTGPANVTLLDPGREPRAPLRYRIPGRRVDNFVVELAMDVSLVGSGARSGQVKQPRHRFRLEATMDNSPGSATVVLVSRVSAVEVVPGANDDPKIISLFERLVPSLVGLSNESRLDDRGRLLSHRIGGVPRTLAGPLRPLALHMARFPRQVWCVLPAEPVGRGGKWQLDEVLDATDFVLRQRTTYTLVGRDGDRLIVEMTSEQSAEPQELGSTPGVGDGTQAFLDSHRGSAQGRATIDLSGGMPIGRSRSESTTATIVFTHQKRNLRQGRVVLDNTTEMTIAAAP